MKNLNEITSRFNDIDDLPVSEEMLGAYMEGNLSNEETWFVKCQLDSSPMFDAFSQNVIELERENIIDFDSMDEIGDISVCQEEYFSTEDLLIIPHAHSESYTPSDECNELEFSLTNTDSNKIDSDIISELYEMNSDLSMHMETSADSCNFNEGDISIEDVYNEEF